MKKHFILYLVLLAALMSCSKKKEEKPVANDFESLMGKDFPAWQYVQTKEDFENLSFFQKVFEQNRAYLTQSANNSKIPKVLHFIWLGPKPFPRESVDNVKSWMGKNPDWTVNFWTDRERPLPHPAMQLRMLKDFKFLQLEDCYYKSDNWGEKSDVLRYEILYQEGGVYADHDVRCIQSFNSLNAGFDLYCGLEMPYKTALSSSVLPTNNLIGSRSHHPVLKHSMDWLQEKWDQIEHDYPGKDKDAVINRVSHRTFLVLGEMFKKYANQENNRDMAMPAFYFNAPKDELAVYARHLYNGSWFENESVFEKNTRERLMMISKKTNKILLFCGIMSALNIIGFIVMFFVFRSQRKPLTKP